MRHTCCVKRDAWCVAREAGFRIPHSAFCLLPSAFAYYYFQLTMLSLLAPLLAGVGGSIMASGPADQIITGALAS